MNENPLADMYAALGLAEPQKGHCAVLLRPSYASISRIGTLERRAKGNA